MIIDVTQSHSSILLPYKPKKLAVGEVDVMEAIPEKYLKTVVFLCVDEERGSIKQRIPKATGFFVRVQIEDSLDLQMDYVVTARHCIDEAHQYGQIYIRVNRNSGSFIEFPTNIDAWYLHDSADVAAIPILRDDLPVNIQPSDLDTASLKSSDFVGGAPDYKIVFSPYGKQHEIQPRVGHQVYFLGLFTEHYGQEHNLPIARFGNISRMPSAVTMIDTLGTKFSVIAYLVEFHSWGGHSGSPVFFLYPIIVEHVVPLGLTNGNKLDIPVHIELSWATSFMGLVSGHYDIAKEAQTTGEYYGHIQTELNSGVAIVTPAIAVTELLMREDLVQYRKKLRDIAESKRPTPTLDIAGNREAFTQDDFLRDLRKVIPQTESPPHHPTSLSSNSIP